MLAGENNAIWTGTRDGLYRFGEDGFEDLREVSGSSGMRLGSLAFSEDGRIIIGSDSGAIELTASGDQITAEFLQELSSIKIEAIYTSKNGETRFGTNEGIYCRSGVVFSRCTFREGIASNVVTAIFEDASGRMWLGTAEKGISLKEGGRFTTINTDNGLADNSITRIMQDSEGNIWIGTENNGISRLGRKEIYNYTTDHGLIDNVVWSITEDSRGRIWIGTDGGVSCLENGKFKNYPFPKHEDFGILGLAVDSKDNIWFIEEGCGIHCLEKGRIIDYTLEDGLSSDKVMTIHIDESDVVWIGTWDKGADYLTDGGFQNISSKDGLPSDRVIAICGRGMEDIWFGTWGGGICHYENGRYISYNMEDGLAGNEILCLIEDSRGRIISGTYNGFSIFDGSTFTNYSVKDGLSNNVCYFIVEDDGGDLWIGTNKGLNRFDGENFKTYTMEDGLISNEMNRSAGFIDSKKNLWAGGLKGITKFRYETDSINDKPPQVCITRWRLFEDDISIAGDKRFKHNQNFFKFDFLGLCYSDPEGVVYKYMLEGLDKQWQTTKLRTVQYTSIPPGRYSFKLKAMNNDGIWSEETGDIDFTVAPPFWSTFWFMGLCLFGVIGLIYWRVNDLRKRNILLIKTVEERTVELKDKIEELEESAQRIKKLEGLLPICSGCKKIRHEEEDQEDTWIQIEEYFHERTKTQFSHGLCPDCIKEFYPDYYEKKYKKGLK